MRKAASTECRLPVPATKEWGEGRPCKHCTKTTSTDSRHPSPWPSPRSVYCFVCSNNPEQHDDERVEPAERRIHPFQAASSRQPMFQQQTSEYDEQSDQVRHTKP